ncbi:MAG TPA: carboxypeptidase-like regulatory domain-containing protein, partial [Chitinophagales bacterium]|nr:carboxypeptidase-like regulatory domain-containing protein [Chitinophagales bacterium]
MKHIYFHCCSLVFLLLFSSQVWAQKAVLRGTVTDNKNEPIPSVSVKATNTATNTTSSVLTDLDGVYEIGNLESGSYSVVFSFVGYQNTTKNISLSKGQNLELSIQLLEDNQVLGEV